MTTEVSKEDLQLKTDNDPSRSPLTPDFTAGLYKYEDLDKVLDLDTALYHYLHSATTPDTISRENFDIFVNEKIDAAL